MSAEHLRETQKQFVELGERYAALQIERNFLRALFDAVEWLSDPEGTLVGINPGPEQEAIQRAYDEARAYYIDCEAAEAAQESH